jgi:protein gp37
MSEHSGIEWTDATWNPVTGCTAVSPGCANCYAARLTATRLKDNPKYAGLATATNGVARWTGEIRCHTDELEAPLKWRKPRRVFVNSMSDTFHAGVPVGFLDRMFAVMALTPWHTYQVLTKRPTRAAQYICSEEDRIEGITDAVVALSGPSCARRIEDGPWPLPNVWLGASVEDQERADERIPDLIVIPAAVRFLSVEPLLGPIDVTPWISFLDWVIVGGESGPNARAVDPQWIRSLRDQCVRACVPFFFKQWGEHGQDMRRVGKVRAGRVLDGRTWDEMPCRD